MVWEIYYLFGDLHKLFEKKKKSEDTYLKGKIVDTKKCNICIVAFLDMWIICFIYIARSLILSADAKGFPLI